MTRDEAIKLAHEKWIKPSTKSSENIVDILSALGILKLDEPKSAQQKFESEMEVVGYGPSCIAIKDIRAALEAAGLRIVEK